MVTVDESEAFVPPFGFWSTTTPSLPGSVVGESTELTVKPAASRSDVAVASSSPTTSGTDTCFDPDEMLIRTVHPRFTFLPASGYCATTVRAGLLLGT